MTQNKDLELLLREGLESPSRRRLLRNSGIVLLGLASGYAPALARANVEPQYLVDLNGMLKNELKESREAPRLQISRKGLRSDFDEHLSRLDGSLPGLDMSPVAYPTEIVPAASGYVNNIVDDYPESGMAITVYHPFGYVTFYAHLNSRYIRYRKVERNDITAVMGNSGTGAREITHLHFTLYGPEYTKYLSGVKVQKLPAGTNNSLNPYALDPEEFSISGKGKELPYQRLDDKTYDELLWKRHFEAEKYLEGVLKEFPKDEVKVTPRTFLENKFRVRSIDREIEFIYSAILAGKHPFSANDKEKVLKMLQAYMREVPRLTAPIKELERADNYHYINKEPVKVYGK